MGAAPEGGRARKPLARDGDGQDAHAEPARAVVLETDDAVHEREQGVVLGETHVLARLPLRAVLAEDDRPAANLLAAEALDPEPLGVAVAPVPARALPFLVRHLLYLPSFCWGDDGGLGLDLVDPHGREGLSMSAR